MSENSNREVGKPISPVQLHQWVYTCIGVGLMVLGIIGTIVNQDPVTKRYAEITAIVGAINILISQYRRRHP